MNATEPRRQFRALLAGHACVHPASVFDPISARIAYDLGFETGMFAGSIASMAVLGAPDLTVLTLSEFADQARRICRAAPLPLLVDADHGYGNALNVMRTVEELEHAGVAALTIEDTALPRGFAAPDAALIPLEEGVGKIRAALAARDDPSLVIVARTSAAGIADVNEAAARARAYAAAGADALFLTGIADRDALAAVTDTLDLPVIIAGARGDLADTGWLAARRVRISLQGHQPFLAAIRAVHDTMAALRAGAPPASLTGVADAHLVRQVTRETDYESWTGRFLSGANPGD
jgi:carboxyvinyl-carboxyphosphonate phosphorylmutase